MAKLSLQTTYDARSISRSPAIKELPEAEVRDLAKWLQEYLEEKWDRQIEADFESGKLDRLITRAESDIARNKLRK
jgi:hypothetical protein